MTEKAILNRNIRLIPRLDIKGENLIKGVHLEGLRVIGPPNEYALKYYESGADELIYIDTVASLYGRNNLLHIVEKAARNIFIPITVGGGINTVDDAMQILRAGADKVAINTGAIANPEIINQLANHLGSQCIVLSIQVIKNKMGTWMAYTDNGREPTGLDAIEWAARAVELGAGEILITSVDQEGTEKGFDLELVKSITDRVEIPVIASGGLGTTQDFINTVREGHADAIAVASALHYNRVSVKSIKAEAYKNGLPVRIN
jgi:cyclase